MLDKKTVLDALRCPNMQLVKYALTYANLSKKEESCLYSTVIEDETEETAAENMGYSRDFVAKHKRKAIERLQQAWEFCPMIPVLLNYKKE